MNHDTDNGEYRLIDLQGGLRLTQSCSDSLCTDAGVARSRNSRETKEEYRLDQEDNGYLCIQLCWYTRLYSSQWHEVHHTPCRGVGTGGSYFTAGSGLLSIANFCISKDHILQQNSHYNLAHMQQKTQIYSNRMVTDNLAHECTGNDGSVPK